MERLGIRAEERTGLIVAVALHLALFGLLIVQGLFPAPVIDPPQRMTVSLAEDVGLSATAPDPVAESRASTAPTMDLNPAPAPEQEVPAPPQVERPAPQVQSPVPAPNSAADNRPRRRPDPPRTQSQPQSSQRSGGSRLGDNFLDGAGDSTRTSETRIPASQIGNSAKASLFQAVARQLRPHWQPPSGPEVEKIVTKVRFRLNPDGTLAGAPSVAGQRGVNATNRAQAGRHGEQAIRAVQLAAPFDLPDEYYEAWKLITVDFDWRLAQ
ncbi:energy transducer TonB [Erythrobacter sp. AP23]|uniref:energy transducer TonB n=1 Tax=Erythrobacter sp. AP23 TaxID=499656 RepID=UPI00076D9A78|nr:energy transducer TonB [Erythrobacter sp. AP23]KWV94592.1 energy transducer TonB [Erythrobacter sp. AP23]